MSEESLLFGIHAVRSALEHDPGRITGLWIDRGRRDRRLLELVELAQAAGVAVQWADAKTLERQSGAERHQGVVARYRAPSGYSEQVLYERLDAATTVPLVLVLDGVTDPHNLGACLRSADGAGALAVVVPKDRAVGLTPVVRKVASGAAETVPLVQVTNLARTLDALKARGLWVVGTAGEAASDLYSADLNVPLALVMGAEGKGLRRLTAERCDLLVHIPMLGAVESLNVSVATGVCLFEALRQRRAAAG